MRGPPAKLMVGAQIILEWLQKRTNGAARFLLNGL
jgi:hypothetical protein